MQDLDPSLLLLLASLVPLGFLITVDVVRPLIGAFLLPAVVKRALSEPGDGTEAEGTHRRQSADWRSWTLASLGAAEMILWSVGAILIGVRGHALWWEVLAVASGASSWVSPPVSLPSDGEMNYH